MANILMDMLGGKPKTIEVLKKEAADYEKKAVELTERADILDRIKTSKDAITKAKVRIKQVAPSIDKKWIYIGIGVVVLLLFVFMR